MTKDTPPDDRQSRLDLLANIPDDEHKRRMEGAFEAIAQPPKLTRHKARLIEHAAAIEADEAEAVLFQHSTFCQTCLPYRNPGDAVREWERANGKARLKMLAGEALDPATQDWRPVGLPYGPKPRLILMHINSEAIRQQSRSVDVERSLTSFTKRLRLDPGGRTIRTIKDQLMRLSASTIRLGVVEGDRAVTINTQIMRGFELWLPKNERQRVLWPSMVHLSPDYFESLQKHAIPLDDRALMALSGNAMALDVYCWLANRIWRIEWGQKAFIPWVQLKAQFGWHYRRMSDFKKEFRATLRQVHSQYAGARIDMDGRGITLWHSPSPIRGREPLLIERRGQKGVD